MCKFVKMKYVMQNLFENEPISRQALEVSKEGFKSYFENGPVAMCVNSPENQWMEVNQEFCRLMGYEKEELLSMDWSQITHPDDILANKELVLKVKNGELDHFKLEKRYIRKDGRIIYATLSLVAARNPDGSINHMIASFIDNTEHHQAIENLISAKNKAEESDRLKSAFLQNISHEIRTPMNSIIGFLEILEDPGFSRNEKKLYANIVNKNGQRLLNTIHDIIEISKIMTSNIELNPTRVEINSFVRERYNNFKPFIEEKGLVFTLNCKIPVDATLMIDEAKLDAVLSKILDNAYKFTSEGSIDLSIKAEGEWFAIVVKDTGVGIEPEKLSAVFQPFYQADHDFNRKHEGAGLGLSISKAYIEMLGGKIWIESSQDTGTTVSFTLPNKLF